MDLQVISYRDSAPISAIDFSSPGSEESLAITGRKFLNVTAVLINGVVSPQYTVFSPTSIVAVIPRSQRGREIISVTVLTSSVGQTGASVLSFEFRGGRTEASGLTYIIQTFTMILLATPGSDIFNPELGGGLLGVIGTFDATGAGFRASVSQAVTRTITQMLRLQAGAVLPAEDKLASARLLEASYDRDTALVSVRIQVYSSTGQAADAGMTLSTESPQ